MREELAQRIENGFTEAEYPGDHNIGVWEIAQFIGQKEWRKVPIDVIARSQAAIIVFSPAAYRFYLPAFLCAVLRHPELEGLLEGAIAYSLIASFTPDNLKKIPESAVAFFNHAEKLLIVEYLEKYGELFPASGYVLLDDSVAELQNTITFWKDQLLEK